MPAKRKSPAKRPPSDAQAIRAAAAKLGPDVVVEPFSATSCYVYSPPGKVWAVDPEIHVLMPAIYHPDDLTMSLGWLAAGLVDCPTPGCEFCGRFVAAEKAEALRVGLDSARL